MKKFPARCIPKGSTKIHHQISIKTGVTKDFGSTLGTSKVSDACKLSLRNPADRRERRGVTTEAYNNTPQGGTIEDNAADDILMVDQGLRFFLTPEQFY